jgi:succinyl-diaminopimelate desuccinylase
MECEARVKTYISQHKTGLVCMLRDLISIPTVNPPGDCCIEFVDYFSALLPSWGMEHRVIPVAHESHPRHSLLASWGEGESGLHFHAHYDVVAAQSPEQFHATERNGRLYGRGSSDMKGGIVAMLFALRALRECRISLSKKITVTLVPDEETGGPLGIRHLAAAGLLPRPAMGTLMPEPTSGVIWNACRGALSLKVIVKGRTAHVGLPHQGVNAFEEMLGVMNSLVALKSSITTRKTSLPIHPPEAAASVMVLGGQSGSGTNFNSVPESAWFSIDRRINPEEGLAAARRELELLFETHRRAGSDIEVVTMQEGEPAVSPADAPLAKVLAQTVAEITGAIPSFEICPGILETRFFTNERSPGYGYGPGLLHISHGPEEYVELDSLVQCAMVYALSAMRLLG